MRTTNSKAGSHVGGMAKVLLVKLETGKEPH